MVLPEASVTFTVTKALVMALPLVSVTFVSPSAVGVATVAGFVPDDELPDEPPGEVDAGAPAASTVEESSE